MQAKLEILLAAGLYIHWPASAAGEPADDKVLTMGVVGGSAGGQELEKLAAGKQIGGRQVIVRHYPSAAAVQLCQILFITSSASRDDRLALIQRYGNSPVLLAGDSPGFLQEGGSLNFQADGGKVRFVLNPQSLDRQKLVVDPRFSRLGRAASQPGGPGALPAA